MANVADFFGEVPVRAWGYADGRPEEGYGNCLYDVDYEYGKEEILRPDVPGLRPRPLLSRSHKTKMPSKVRERPVEYMQPARRSSQIHEPSATALRPEQRRMEYLPTKAVIEDFTPALRKQVTITFRPARGTATKDKACKARDTGIREYTLRQTSRLGTIMDDYCHAMKCRPSETKFILRKPEEVRLNHYPKSGKKSRSKMIRTRVREDDTPLDLRLEDGDEIIVCPRENGEGNGLVLQVALILIGVLATTCSRK